jgi:enoyl-CoA hydratase/carnithine racemase
VDLKTIRYEPDAGVGLITLDRPGRLNAWTGRMHTEYRWALAQAEDDPSIRVVVVTGAGRGFCAGADSRALEGHVERGGYDAGVDAGIDHPGYGAHEQFDENFAYHFGLSVPVIAAINGPAAGVGLVLACFADIRFAAAGAKLTTSFGRLGLPAEYGISWILPRLVGAGRAADHMLSSRIVLAEEAFAMGHVNRVVEADRLLDEVLAYARGMATEIAPTTLRAAKRQLWLDYHRGVGEAVSESERLLEQMTRSADFTEGVAALTEKRPPRFSDPDD